MKNKIKSSWCGSEPALMGMATAGILLKFVIDYSPLILGSTSFVVILSFLVYKIFVN